MNMTAVTQHMNGWSAPPVANEPEPLGTFAPEIHHFGVDRNNRIHLNRISHVGNGKIQARIRRSNNANRDRDGIVDDRIAPNKPVRIHLANLDRSNPVNALQPELLQTVYFSLIEPFKLFASKLLLDDPVRCNMIGRSVVHRHPVSVGLALAPSGESNVVPGCKNQDGNYQDCVYLDPRHDCMVLAAKYNTKTASVCKACSRTRAWQVEQGSAWVVYVCAKVNVTE